LKNLMRQTRICTGRGGSHSEKRKKDFFKDKTGADKAHSVGSARKRPKEPARAKVNSKTNNKKGERMAGSWQIRGNKGGRIFGNAKKKKGTAKKEKKRRHCADKGERAPRKKFFRRGKKKERENLRAERGQRNNKRGST